MSQNLAATLARASDAASAGNSGEVALEHVLLALCDDPEAQAVLSASQVDAARLKASTLEFLRTLPPTAPGTPLVVSAPLTRILEAAAAAARGGRRRDINGAIVLAAIIGDGRSHAAQILQACGLTFDEAIRALQAALAPQPQPSHAPLPEAPGSPDPQAPQPREDVRRADDVLAQARERVQSRSAPTLRDIMKDTPKTAASETEHVPVPSDERLAENGPADDSHRDGTEAEPEAGNQAVADDAGSYAYPQTGTGPVPVNEPAPNPAPEPKPEPEFRQPPQHQDGRGPAAPSERPVARPQDHQHHQHHQHHQPTQPRPNTPSPPHGSPLPGEGQRPPQAGEQFSRPKPQPSRAAPPGYPQPPGQEQQNRPPPPFAQPYPQTPQRPNLPPPGMPFDLQRPTPVAMPPPLPGMASPQQPGQPFPPPQAPSHPGQRPPPGFPSNRQSPAPPFPGGPQTVPQSMPPNLGAAIPAGMDNRGGALPAGVPQQQRGRQQTPQTAGRAAKSGKSAKPVKAAMQIGELAENIPRKMRVGVTERIEIRLAKSGVKAIAEGLEGGGQAWTHQVVIAKAMSVRLRAPDGGFFIETASPETQWIEGSLGFESDDYASWRFLVTPQERGWASLQIIISARTVGADGVAAETALPDQVIEVKVKRNLKRTILRWIGWIVAAVIGGALAKFGEGAVDLVSAILKQTH